jgi:hypothetical protein
MRRDYESANITLTSVWVQGKSLEFFLSEAILPHWSLASRSLGGNVMTDLNLPTEVLNWLVKIFSDCDRRITQKLQNNPNLPEESLDLTWIEHLSQFSAPVTLASEWVAKIESHFLGGLRHFHRWEIADIGLLLFIRRAGKIRTSKVALLQSKRLYPSNNRIVEEGRIDYEIGFARIADPEDLARSIAVEHEFEFTVECVYKALQAKSEQVEAIKEYEQTNKLPVYYQFYNPWKLPFKKRVPLSEYAPPPVGPGVGTRIIPAKAVHKLISKKQKDFSPSFKDLSGLTDGNYVEGWPLAYFVTDLFFGCREGALFDGIQDERVRTLFYRRSGPIAAAIAITIEGP